MLAETWHKSLPRLGKTVHVDLQASHHFLANAAWSVEGLRTKRLELWRQALGTAHCILVSTRRATARRGIRPPLWPTNPLATSIAGQREVSINAPRVLDATTFPLFVRIYQPQTRMEAGEVSKTKMQLAIELVEELPALDFRCSVVVADSLYGESGVFISALQRLGLQSMVALPSNLGVRMLPGQRVRQTRWRPCDHVFTDGTSELCLIRETSPEPANRCAPPRSPPIRRRCRLRPPGIL